MYSDEMTHLENKLSGLGYRFMITKDGELIYSNLSDEDLEIARSVAGDAIDDAKTLTASRFEVSVIKNTFWHGEKIFCITAAHHHGDGQKRGAAGNRDHLPESDDPAEVKTGLSG